MADFTTSVYYPYVRQSEPSRKRFFKVADRFLSRCLDIIIAAAGLLLLGPLLLIIGILIKRDTPGPILYRGLRLGKDGKVFKILKFRTMFECPQSYQGTRVTANGDERITPLGHWLRDTKINELPQLWNVLRGDMSLVGPRPEDPDIAMQWPEDVRRKMTSVRPGITSPASIIYRNEEKMLSGASLMEDYVDKIMPSKLRLDLLYIRNRNVLTDLDIIFWTAVAFLPTLRGKPIPGRSLYFGPLSQFMSRFVNWFCVDFLLSLLAVWMGGVAYRLIRVIDVGWWHSFVASFGMALCFSLVNALLGLNRISWAKARAQSAIELLLSTFISTMVLLALNWYVQAFTFPTLMIVISSAIAAFFFIVARYRERLFTGLVNRLLNYRKVARTVGERVLIIGAGDMGEFAAWFFTRAEFAKTFSVIGYVDDDPKLANVRVADKTVLGVTEEIPAIVDKYDVGVVVFAITRIEEPERKRILEICANTPARLVMFPDLIAIIKKSMAAAGNTKSQPVQLAPVMAAAASSGFLDELDGLIRGGKTEEAHQLIEQYRKAIYN